MSWKTVYVNEDCHISNQLNNMRIKINDEFVNVPLSDLQLVIFAHDKMTITLPIINKLIENNVGIITTNKAKDPIGMFLPFNGHSQVFKKLSEQINWKIVRKKQLWKIIVENKIISEIETLKRIGKNENNNLENLKNTVLSNDSTNREGIAAKQYFPCIFGENFVRGNSDNVNYALNYGYKILASYISRYITSRGYITQIGIFHKGGSNPYNLTYDFIEVFRYTIDIWVYYNVHLNNEFYFLNKQAIIMILNSKLKYKNKICRLESVIENVINDYFKYLNKEIDKITFPKFNSIVYETK